MAVLAILALLFTASQFIIIVNILLLPKHEKGCKQCKSENTLEPVSRNFLSALGRLYWEKVDYYQCSHCGWKGVMR